jgi:hypothetical protein
MLFQEVSPEIYLPPLNTVLPSLMIVPLQKPAIPPSFKIDFTASAVVVTVEA